MYKKYYPEDIINFYRKMRFTGFLLLSEQRAEEIRQLAEANRFYFSQNTNSLKGLMSSAASKLTTSSRNFGLTNSDEIILFYLTLVDPTFLFLEAYECANKKDQVRPLCLHNFRIYDPYIVYYEVLLQRRFRWPVLAELWTRGQIDTSCLLDEHGITK